MSLFSATPDFLKWRDKGFSARPLAVAGALGAGSLDLERLQARSNLARPCFSTCAARASLTNIQAQESCRPSNRAARVFCWALVTAAPLCSPSGGKESRRECQACVCLLGRSSSASGRR